MVSLARRRVLMPCQPLWLYPMMCTISIRCAVIGSPVNGCITLYQTCPSVSSHGVTSSPGTGISSRGRSVAGSRLIQM